MFGESLFGQRRQPIGRPGNGAIELILGRQLGKQSRGQQILFGGRQLARLGECAFQ
jgi:hypothetical protein